MTFKPTVADIIGELQERLARFVDQPSSYETRAEIEDTLTDYLEARMPAPRSQVDLVNVTIEDGVLRGTVRTNDPGIMLAAANYGLINDPASLGLVKVDGSHGYVWTWPHWTIGTVTVTPDEGQTA